MPNIERRRQAMTEYRRGCDLKGMQRLWHFDRKCDSYPTRNFVIQMFQPSDDDLCARCAKYVVEA